MKQVKITLASLLFVSLVACGGAEQKEETKAEATTKTTVEKTETKTSIAAVEDMAIEVAAVGETMMEIAFEPATMTLVEGAEVTMTFKNQSSAAGMLHNFVLIPVGIGQEIATAGISAGADGGFTPDDDRIIIATKMTTMGEELTVTFTAPAAGEYEYICTYPGHYPAMVGKLTVTQ
tara:strand:- start:4260 stop:4790 length:531 start_codon:yes stop_codon:yes gene_type:complete